tara:strand:- start:2025 stop:2426 length:402 start_codon:yes stop_codon:yes gene_type:complete
MLESLIIGFGLTLLCIVLAILWYVVSNTKQTKIQLSEADSVIRLALDKLEQLDDELHEIRSGNQALGKKVKELIVTINGLDDKQQQLADQDPQSRFYNKGAKLIAAGATLDEVMRECDLPRAEVELLFSLHQR